MPVSRDNLYIDPEDGEISLNQGSEDYFVAKDEEPLLTDMLGEDEEDPQELNF